MTQTRADFNTAKQKQAEYFSDLPVDMAIHPVTNELTRLTNEQAVKRSIRNIILTNKGERLFQPSFGGNIRALLFEPMNDMTSESLKHAINDAITNHEPRAKIHSIEVIPDDFNQLYRVNILFLIVNAKEPSGMTVSLYRIR